eukprot:UN00055
MYPEWFQNNFTWALCVYTFFSMLYFPFLLFSTICTYHPTLSFITVSMCLRSCYIEDDAGINSTAISYDFVILSF